MKKTARTNILVAALLVVAALHFSGCATPAQSEAMASSRMDFGRKNDRSVTITVTGGSETKSTGKSQISDDDFASAINASIEKSGLFSKILGLEASDFQLNAEIVRVDQPTIGFNMTVTLEVNWTLIRRSTGKVAWQKAETSTYTATMGEAFAGVTRLRMATEGAARLNIDRALGEIGKLEL